jgi:hypothetical protein
MLCNTLKKIPLQQFLAKKNTKNKIKFSNSNYSAGK